MPEPLRDYNVALGVVPQWDLKDIYAGMVQFMVLQILAVCLLLMFPGMTTWLTAAK